MSRVVVPETFLPNLKFRYEVDFTGQPDLAKYTVRYCQLPTWDDKKGFKNKIKMRFYHFERKTIPFLKDIKTDNIPVQIRLLNPLGESIFVFDMLGDVTKVKYGEVNWGEDDCIEATLTFEPKEVNFLEVPKS